MNKIKKQSGFTLIEILVVIGIIAVLATIVLIAINPARQFRQAHDTQRVSNVNAILNAVGQYVVDNKGKLPPSLSGVTATGQLIAKTGGLDLCADIVPKYISSLPVDPSATGPVTDCTTSYDSLYKISQDTNGRITVSAVGEEPAGTVIQVTR